VSRTFAGAVALLCSSVAWGDSVSLKQLLDAADQQNVDRKISAEQRRRAEAEFSQAWTALLPALTASGAYTRNQYESAIGPPVTPMKIVIQPLDQLDATFRIDLPLVDTSRWYRALVASSAEEGAVQREALTRDQVMRQVIGGWYLYAASLSVRESAKRSVAVAEAQAKLQDIRQKAGAATDLELLRANAEVQRNRQVVADSEVLVATTRRTLRTLTFLDPGDEAVLPEDNLTPEPRFEELEPRVVGLPAVLAAEQDVAIAARLATAQQLTLVPIIGAQFTERLTNATGFAGKAAVYSAGVGFAWRLDVPTFEAFRVAQAAHSTALLAAERARLQARDQIHSDWQRHNASLIKVEAARAQVQAAQRAAVAARDRYAVGASTQIDVIQAERDLFSAEVAQIQARTELASARASLRISANLPLGIE
jgi:outer membrane protein TolC